jgi:hypothetical protein
MRLRKKLAINSGRTACQLTVTVRNDACRLRPVNISARQPGKDISKYQKIGEKKFTGTFF